MSVGCGMVAVAPYGPVQACNGIDFAITSFFLYIQSNDVKTLYPTFLSQIFPYTQ
jgi:hypothetical protein